LSRGWQHRNSNFIFIQILSNKLEAEAKKLTGLDQYSYSRYAKAFEVFPRILAENAGVNAN
jgi:chaperonin GroEL (HSP60 family)